MREAPRGHGIAIIPTANQRLPGLADAQH
jgi:hypothetical protein